MQTQGIAVMAHSGGDGGGDEGSGRDKLGDGYELPRGVTGGGGVVRVGESGGLRGGRGRRSD